MSRCPNLETHAQENFTLTEQQIKLNSNLSYASLNDNWIRALPEKTKKIIHLFEDNLSNFTEKLILFVNIIPTFKNKIQIHTTIQQPISLTQTVENIKNQTSEYLDLLALDPIESKTTNEKFHENFRDLVYATLKELQEIFDILFKSFNEISLFVQNNQASKKFLQLNSSIKENSQDKYQTFPKIQLHFKKLKKIVENPNITKKTQPKHVPKIKRDILLYQLEHHENENNSEKRKREGSSMSLFSQNKNTKTISTTTNPSKKSEDEKLAPESPELQMSPTLFPFSFFDSSNPQQLNPSYIEPSPEFSDIINSIPQPSSENQESRSTNSQNIFQSTTQAEDQWTWIQFPPK